MHVLQKYPASKPLFWGSLEAQQLIIMLVYQRITGEKQAMLQQCPTPRKICAVGLSALQLMGITTRLSWGETGRNIYGAICLVRAKPSMGRIAHGAKRPYMGWYAHGANCPWVKKSWHRSVLLYCYRQ